MYMPRETKVESVSSRLSSCHTSGPSQHSPCPNRLLTLSWGDFGANSISTCSLIPLSSASYCSIICCASSSPTNNPSSSYDGVSSRSCKLSLCLDHISLTHANSLNTSIAADDGDESDDVFCCHWQHQYNYCHGSFPRS